ncbi:preprotein translocase subunit SecB [Algoriphagus sp. 4150]|uniref:preprotein translocase subunit SecB n=1 Tax=Algoriphagus sp. 4150 TaxID=2817756 RepID=UPI0028551187|nr:preprotein translocase subunit SecB [Algoriphagus sp. 4150]MDR7130174.1 preprotein translocase subunit SecB [Algoriphagus sp. 4150]
MKAKFSPLQLLDFKLLESHYEFIVPEDEAVEPSQLFLIYPVEIDFDMSPIEEDGEIQLITRIEVNVEDGNKIPGYKLMVEGGGTFKISESEEIEEGLRNNLLKFSTLNMMINNLRNIIYQITNLGPLGGYLLPPIDITKLLNDKAKEQEVK